MTATSLPLRLATYLRPCVYLSLAALAACSSTPPTPSAATPAATATPHAAPIKIGVALGGGAAKGFAHIGVIKMLEANGFTPAVVAGTSAGSVVGAHWCVEQREGPAYAGGEQDRGEEAGVDE